MKAAEATLNYKCVFSVKNLKFLECTISKEEIQKDPEKVKATGYLPKPENVSEQTRLLCKANQVGKLTKNLENTT